MPHRGIRVFDKSGAESTRVLRVIVRPGHPSARGYSSSRSVRMRAMPTRRASEGVSPGPFPSLAHRAGMVDAPARASRQGHSPRSRIGLGMGRCASEGVYPGHAPRSRIGLVWVDAPARASTRPCPFARASGWYGWTRQQGRLARAIPVARASGWCGYGGGRCRIVLRSAGPAEA